MFESIRKELLLNQIWHGLNFLAKALLLGVLTPYMVLKWGEARFGMYALASSLVVCLAVMDGGIRDATRIALCDAELRIDSFAFRTALQRGVMSFLLLVAVFFVISLILGVTGVFSLVLHLPREGDFVICFTILLTGLTMTAVLLLEPLAARNQLSLVKKASTVGSILALPFVALSVAAGGGPMAVILVYFVCQVTPLIWIWVQQGLVYENPFVWLSWSDYWTTYRSGGVMYFINLMWLIRTHGLVFFVSAVTGPAEAGVFYILIRLSEVISILGAAASETLLASLKSAENTDQRFAYFSHTYAYCLVFCGYATLVLVFLGHPMIELFYHHTLMVTDWDIFGAAVFGLAGAFAALLFGSGYGLNLLPMVSRGNLLVAVLTCLGCYFLQSRFGAAGTLLFGAFAHIALIPCARNVTRLLRATVAELWLWPLRPLLVPWIISVVILWDAHTLANPLLQFLILAVVSFFAFIDWRRLHSPTSR